jgi:hypothetical protein
MAQEAWIFGLPPVMIDTLFPVRANLSSENSRRAPVNQLVHERTMRI